MENHLLRSVSQARLIIIMGVSGCGKSTLAKLLADYFRYTYLDADDFHSQESRTRMAQGIPLTDEQRAPWVASIRKTLENHASSQVSCTLAFSGLKQKHRQQLRNTGLETLFLFLDGSKDTIFNRMQHREHHFMPPKLLDSQFSSMERPSNEKDVYVLSIEYSKEEVCKQAISIIHSHAT